MKKRTPIVQGVVRHGRTYQPREGLPEFLRQKPAAANPAGNRAARRAHARECKTKPARKDTDGSD